MAKKFMFVCVGILALTVAFLLGAQLGRAEYVDHSASGLVAMANVVTGPQALDENGAVWRFENQGWSGPSSWGPLPIPVSQVKFFIDEHRFVSGNNEAWVQMTETEWVNYGPPPGMTATQPSTWGSIKSQFKD
jgi:hypothetical protein